MAIFYGLSNAYFIHFFFQNRKKEIAVFNLWQERALKVKKEKE